MDIHITKYMMTTLVVVLLAACGGGNSESKTDTPVNSPAESPAESPVDNSVIEPGISPVVNGNWYRPQLFIKWQIQLNNKLNISYPVELFDVDLIDTPESTIRQIHAAGKKVICYFSAGTFEDWRPDASAFRAADLGKALDDWPGERWLDIRSRSVRDIMKKRLDLARKKGCDGVDPDNVDGYTQNSGYNLTAKNQINYNRFIANEAHLRNLSVGLKNDLSQIEELVDYYDFAVNEQCQEYDECHLLSPFIESGKPVLHIEYAHEKVSTAVSRQTVCANSINHQFSTLILPIGLDDKFRYDC